MAEDTNKNTTGGAEATPEGEAAAVAATGKKKKMLMLASAGLGVVGVAVAVGVYFFMGSTPEDAHSAQAHATTVPELAVYDVPEFTLNLLADEGTGARFLKIRLALELEHSADAAAMEKLLPRLQDDWGTFLRQLRPTDLQGSAAMQRLREGLLRRAMQSVAPVPIKAVYVRDMLVQ